MSLRSQGDGSGRWSFCSRRGSSAARLSDLKPGTIPRVKIGEEKKSVVSIEVGAKFA
jgi:hypothetical protein